MQYKFNNKTTDFTYRNIVDNQILKKSNKHDDIIKNFIIRHRKEDVVKQIKIANYQETVVEETNRDGKKFI